MITLIIVLWTLYAHDSPEEKMKKCYAMYDDIYSVTDIELVKKCPDLIESLRYRYIGR